VHFPPIGCASYLSTDVSDDEVGSDDVVGSDELLLTELVSVGPHPVAIEAIIVEIARTERNFLFIFSYILLSKNSFFCITPLPTNRS
jgi:hypothetical protein